MLELHTVRAKENRLALAEGNVAHQAFPDFRRGRDDLMKLSCYIRPSHQHQKYGLEQIGQTRNPQLREHCIQFYSPPKNYGPNWGWLIPQG